MKLRITRPSLHRDIRRLDLAASSSAGDLHVGPLLAGTLVAAELDVRRLAALETARA